MSHNITIPVDGHPVHDCGTRLGGTGWAVGALGYGGLSRCSVCGRWWHLRRDNTGHRVASWAPVRWWHFRLRTRIVNHTHPTEGPA